MTHDKIVVAEQDILVQSATMPIGYLEDCRKSATIISDKGLWLFAPSDFFRIRQKYRGYAVSEADRFREGEIISGCCDRADQY